MSYSIKIYDIEEGQLISTLLFKTNKECLIRINQLKETLDLDKYYIKFRYKK